MRTVQRSALCRSRRELSNDVPFLNLLFEQIANSNAYLLANFGIDTTENEPCRVCPIPRGAGAGLGGAPGAPLGGAAYRRRGLSVVAGGASPAGSPGSAP